MNADKIHKIQALHALYVQLTGQNIALRMDRERAWFDWLGCRKPEFTAEDLRTVIHHIKAGIREQKRNPGALKFSNLIGQPDYFEEDLALATAIARPRPPAHTTVRTAHPAGHTERIVPASGSEDAAKPAAGHIPGCLEKLRDAIKP